jgi:hypothetical protein
MSLQSRLDARGVSYDNGMRLSRVFLDSLSLAPVHVKKPAVAAKPARGAAQ